MLRSLQLVKEVVGAFDVGGEGMWPDDRFVGFAKFPGAAMSVSHWVAEVERGIVIKDSSYQPRDLSSYSGLSASEKEVYKQVDVIG